MTYNKPHINPQSYLKIRLVGKKVKPLRLSISEKETEFFEDIPLYRGDKSKKPGKTHLSRSRKSKST